MSEDKNDLNSKLQILSNEYGFDELFGAIEKIKKKKIENKCTILVNEGLHSFPEELFHGEKYVFSRQFLDFKDEKSLSENIIQLLEDLAIFLKKNKWQEIYLVISGHAILNMYVKMAVYRITRIETIDWIYDGSGNYLKLKIPLRETLFSRE